MNKFQWLHSLRQCCLTGRTDIHIAHLHEAYLTSLNQKVSDVLVLPLAEPLHREQHNTREFWPRAFAGNPVDWAVRLHDLWEARDLEGADELFWDMHKRVNIPYVAAILRKAA